MKVRRTKRVLVPVITLIALLGGCSKAVDNGNNAKETPPPTMEVMEEPDAVVSEEQNMAGPVTDQWIGHWTGPEGLFLDIQPSSSEKPGHYVIQNKDNLDREGSYKGVADGAAIRFPRDGKQLTIRSGTGQETGFKYLAGKQDCLIVIAGREGYCR